MSRETNEKLSRSLIEKIGEQLYATSEITGEQTDYDRTLKVDLQIVSRWCRRIGAGEDPSDVMLGTKTERRQTSETEAYMVEFCWKTFDLPSERQAILMAARAFDENVVAFERRYYRAKEENRTDS